VIFNSEQGSHFTSPQYTGLVEGAGSKLNMDGKGRALDNIFTERLWRAKKWENLYLPNYAGTFEAENGLRDYFDFYNNRQPHQSLDYQPSSRVFYFSNLSIIIKRFDPSINTLIISSRVIFLPVLEW